MYSHLDVAKNAIQIWQSFVPITDLQLPLILFEHWTKYARYTRSNVALEAEWLKVEGLPPYI